MITEINTKQCFFSRKKHFWLGLADISEHFNKTAVDNVLKLKVPWSTILFFDIDLRKLEFRQFSTVFWTYIMK